jgi:hypothetical protein
MRSFVRFVRSIALLALAFNASATCVSAQKVAETSNGPKKGTWGAEVSAGGSNIGDGRPGLLYFLSPNVSLNASAGVFRTTNEAFGNTSTFTQTSFQLGVRRYARSGLGLRPILGAGALLSTLAGTTTVGGYGEAGARWFFTPHLSLGTSAEISATRATGDGKASVIGLNLARFTGAVYF